MASLPEPVTELTAALSRLPGVGPRSAERIALHLVQEESGKVALLASAITDAREKIQLCETCGALTERQPCAICRNEQRNGNLVCVVEQPTDIINVEKSNAFDGRYHVLGGRISPINGVEPEDLRIGELSKRVEEQGITEIILALGTDVEGDATSHYLAGLFGEKGVRVSRIAHGLPAGSGLEFADEMTLKHALDGRREME
ncbi:MAG: recombination protein RecR [Verrucomicrobiales bacterium]|nr:recombination protein RecR [Verrucomicrobiales bacterium]|tara:strand:+ start:915 stop:1517 length:603 start_codon:yes stop_codon:yes gene_type:complete